MLAASKTLGIPSKLEPVPPPPALKEVDDCVCDKQRCSLVSEGQLHHKHHARKREHQSHGRPLGPLTRAAAYLTAARRCPRRAHNGCLLPTCGPA